MQKKCKVHLDYENLCSNLNYLEEYAQKNYDKNKESFVELKKLISSLVPTIYSFGCGLGLDFIAASEVFGKEIKYIGIDEFDWAIKNTSNYKNFSPKLPNTIKFDVGIDLLENKQNTLVICFFNSLFTISQSTCLLKKLIQVLEQQERFYLICDYTINNNYHLPKDEQEFLNLLIKNLKEKFRFKCFEILDGKGIIINGVK